MTERRKALLLLATGTLLGVAVWVFSPWLTGEVEPWDHAAAWLASWIAIAVAGGLVGRLRGVLLPLGYALGQMLVTVKSVFAGQFGALGWTFIAGYAAVASLLALLMIGAAYAWRALRARG